jgi:DNA replication protein DnaC
LKNSEIYKNTENQLDKIRSGNIKIIESRREDIFKEISDIKGHYLKIAQNAILYSQYAIKDELHALEELKNTNDMLEDEIRSLLYKNGYPPDFLDPIYDCKECCDTGYVANGNKRLRCRCFFAHASNTIYSLPEFALPRDISFSSFDDSLFEGDRMPSLKKTLEKFCIGNITKHLYVFGKTGTGKTFFLVSMAKLLKENKVPSLYINSNNLFRVTQEHKASVFSEQKTDPFLYNYIYSSKVLLIDDLGTEAITPSKYSELLEIISQRIRTERSTIIASNLSPIDLKKMYDERIYSRIIGSFDNIKLPGDDLRIILKRRGK